MRFWLIFSLWMCALPAWAAHAYALWGAPRYPAGFAHFDYVNPDAPKGGELRLVSNLRVSTFDKYNPFTIKGSAPAYLSALMFDSCWWARWTKPPPATACWPRMWRWRPMACRPPSACGPRRAFTMASRCWRRT
jgi:hypothetical protein